MLDALQKGLNDHQGLQALTYGASFLGCGGGGDPYLGYLILKDTIERFGPPKIIDIAELPGTAQVATVAGFGAPLIQNEKLFGVDEANLAVNCLSGLLDQAIGYLYAAELGGGNVALPLALSAMTGKPFVNADGMARAFPELNMTSFSLAGIPAAPCVFVDEHGRSLVMADGSADDVTERKGRAFTIDRGMRSIFAGCAMTGGAFKKNAIPNTIALSHAIGQLLLDRLREDNPIACIEKMVDRAGSHGAAKSLFSGKINDITMDVSGGFLQGKVTIANDSAQSMTVHFRNEYLEAVLGKERIAASPDLIILVDQASLYPITTPQLRYGMHVEVITIEAPEVFRDPRYQHIVGLEALAAD